MNFGNNLHNDCIFCVFPPLFFRRQLVIGLNLTFNFNQFQIEMCYTKLEQALKIARTKSKNCCQKTQKVNSFGHLSQKQQTAVFNVPFKSLLDSSIGLETKRLLPNTKGSN